MERFAKTVEALEFGRVQYLDQTELPEREAYKVVTDWQECIHPIKDLEVRGAPLIGVFGAYTMALAAIAGENWGSIRSEMELAAGVLLDTRPTAVNLRWAVDDMLRKAAAGWLAAELWLRACAIHSDDQACCRMIAKHGAQFIEDGDRILTHCNAGALATSGMGTALAPIYLAVGEHKKQVHVYADETRPLLQGSRLTAWELKRAGIPVTVITDSMAGYLMKLGEVDKVIVGADRIVANGDFANKIGTYSLAVLAREHGIPFYVAAPHSTMDMHTLTGERIVIESRNPREVTCFCGRQCAPDGVDAWTPAFDVTPGSLVEAFITDLGIMTWKDLRMRY